ncbi:unnamed protein product [Ranitomeya imitator]|uniref:G-protein coupled receptors family 1 profile domain-containing protein n=1 Tax=Ranitomeya imitator TaxID=111125 RepID=A0ABN9LK57_9NEOB|nr:unnamed protein product [Ranitomeya imitator]
MGGARPGPYDTYRTDRPQYLPPEEASLRNGARRASGERSHSHTLLHAYLNPPALASISSTNILQTISLAIRDVAASSLAISSSVTGSSDQAPAVLSLVGEESPELYLVAGLPADIAESDGNQGKHRVTKRGPALSYPMFTLVTGIVGRWRAVCVTALQRPNSDAAAIRIVVGIAAASLSVTVPLGPFYLLLKLAYPVGTRAHVCRTDVPHKRMDTDNSGTDFSGTGIIWTCETALNRSSTSLSIVYRLQRNTANPLPFIQIGADVQNPTVAIIQLKKFYCAPGTVDRPGYPSGNVAYANVIMPTVFGIICLLGIIGNSVVIYTVFKKSKFRCTSSVPDIFIINLSVVDLLFLLGMPFLIHQLLGNGVWHFGETMCTLITALDTNSQFTSTYILTAMSIDRYLATVYPFTSAKYRKPPVAIMVICILWVLSLLSITPVWMYARLISLPGGVLGCGITLPNPESDIYWYTLYQFFLAFAIPFAVISLAYRRILLKMASSEALTAQRSSRIRTKKVTRTAIAICLVFFICWAPFYVLQIIQLVMDQPTLAFHYAYCVAISMGWSKCIFEVVYSVYFTVAELQQSVIFEIGEKASVPNMRVEIRALNPSTKQCLSSAEHIRTPRYSSDIQIISVPEKSVPELSVSVCSRSTSVWHTCRRQRYS